MFSSKHRLTKKDKPEAILKSGKKAMGKFMVLRFIRNQHKEHRFSVIISTKISNKAVTRNRFRRQIQEIIRLNLETFPPKDHFDILILPKKAIIESTYAELETDLLSLISQLKA
ncbi:ribonuclease P protein component [Candidatus Peregrinibacteria bacterium]|jgi:ribonuclease P protein component|nr:ribonuclease P protein component [Candidatus Peregrinibacteria bacterium]MBT7484483.1 ribonuclease P protein component [Candidatus Peregrinibacteria bacterium]MBT7702625.1 ribonuclease P protein component [Candidatus Peregrinibacteria bacterium]